MVHLRRVPVMGDDATTFTEQGYYSVPRVYIRNSRDMTIKPQYQDLFIARNPPSEVLHIDSDHSPFLSAEKELHQHLLYVAETYSKWILLPRPNKDSWKMSITSTFLFEMQVLQNVSLWKTAQFVIFYYLLLSGGSVFYRWVHGLSVLISENLHNCFQICHARHIDTWWYHIEM